MNWRSKVRQPETGYLRLGANIALQLQRLLAIKVWKNQVASNDAFVKSHKKQIHQPMLGRDRRGGVVVRAFASQSVDLAFIP